MRRTVTLWARSLLRRKAPAANVEEIDAINDILEADTMLAETLDNWFDEATRKEASQGTSQGVNQGRQQGLVKALALQLQLHLRFGPVPAWAQARLDAADEEPLLTWTGAILSATSLSDLFGDNNAAH
jgi:hypothetical protein